MGGVNMLAVVDPRLVLDVLFASAIGFLLFSRVNEARTLWLLRGYLFLVATACSCNGSPICHSRPSWWMPSYSPAHCHWRFSGRGTASADGALGTGRLAVLLGNPQKEFRATAGTVAHITEAAGKLSQQRRGALIVVDLGSDLRPEDFLNPGVTIGAQLSRELLLNLFAADTPLHDGAVLVRGNRIESAGVILPLSRHSVSRYGTRHLAALGITERFDRCICIVVSEETGTLSLANQGRLERPITSSRLQELLRELFSTAEALPPARRTVGSSPSETLS